MSYPQNCSRFNEDKRCGDIDEQLQRRDSASLIPDELLDEVDWRDPVREVRVDRCVGTPVNAGTCFLLTVY
jgi:hypothetical protein